MKGLACCLALMVVLGFAGSAFAQQPGGNQGGNQGGNRGRGNFDPAQMRERYMTELKTRLGSNDDEWKVLSPKLTKVLDAQRSSRSSRGFGGRGGRDNNTRPEDQTPVSKAAADLRAAVENKDAAADDLAKKVAAYREAREKAKAELAAAQKELKELLTARQEAILVSSGLMD